MSFAFSDLRLADVLNPLEEKLNATFLRLVDRREPLSEAEMTRLHSAEETSTRVLLGNFLNEIERYCTAVNLGIAHEDVAKRLYRHKFNRHFIELQPLIKHCRDTQNAPRVFKEFEDVVTGWAEPKTPAERYAEGS